MSEVVISRRGGSGSGGGWGGKTEFVTQIIESDQDFVMPTGVVNNEVSVRIFGGGGGGGGYYCPSRGKDGTKGGGGFGLWVGGSLVATYACGGDTTGSEPGICIISYYPVD